LSRSGLLVSFPETVLATVPVSHRIHIGITVFFTHGEVTVLENRALVFIKPHAITDDFVGFVEKFLRDHHVGLSEPARMGAEEIRKKGIVDRHYFAIARTAVFSSPRDYRIGEGPKDRFREAFGISWEEALEQGRLFNSVEMQEKLGDISGIELNEIWQGEPQVKMAPGLYAGHFRGKDLYCINGFYPGQREVFTSEGAEVVLCEGRFEPGELSWEDFRQTVIGATDPEKAAAGSLRKELLERFTEFGLTSRPVMSQNGVHASAGPLEGLRERMVWLGLDPSEDPFATELQAGGINPERFEELLENPIVTLDGETGPVFDLTEDMDSAEALEKLLDGHR